MVTAQHQHHKHQQLLALPRSALMEFSLQILHAKHFHINVLQMEQIALYQEAVKLSEQH